MYKFGDHQISFSDFGQPVGMKMSAENRWVKKAELIPWKEIDLLHNPEFGRKPRTYRRRAHKEYVQFVRIS